MKASLAERTNGATVLTPEELERYARHIVLREVGGPGQAALKRARVLVIGAGGLGAPVLMYLAAAGVGTLGVIDDDAVSLSNLQRQIIHATDDVGAPKVASAAAAIARLNPHVIIETHAMRLTAANALDIVGRYDLVADGSDNFATRYLVSDACFLAKKPLVTATLGVFDGTLTTIRAHECEGRQAKPDLPLPVSGRAAARIDPGLRGSGNSRRTDRRARLDDGAGSDPRNCRLRHGARRTIRHVRRARHALRNDGYAWDPGNPLSGEKPTIRDLSAHV